MIAIGISMCGRLSATKATNNFFLIPLHISPSFHQEVMFVFLFLESGLILGLALTSRLCGSDAVDITQVLRSFAASVFFTLLKARHHVKKSNYLATKNSWGRRRILEDENNEEKKERPSQSPVIF